MEYYIYDKVSRTPKARITTESFAAIDSRTKFRPVMVDDELRLVATSAFSYGSERAGITIIVQEGDFFIKL